MSWYSSVSKVACCSAGRPRFDFRQGQNSSLSHHIETGSGSAQVSEAVYPWIERQKREADRSFSSNDKVKDPLPLLQIVHGAAQKRAIVRTGFLPEPLGWGTCCHLRKGGGHLEDVVCTK
jgi:hypothetical protein